MNRIKWNNVGNISGVRYICGYCGTNTSPIHCYVAERDLHNILICNYCNHPTYIIKNDTNILDWIEQIPGVKVGEDIEGLPETVKKLYDEARSCVAASAYTASVMASRKILMNVAVEKGAEEGKSFKFYVQYLEDKNYVPPDSHDWVDQIRDKGNEANHEIKIMTLNEAEELISLVEMLLKIMYEYPNRGRKSSSP